jgi:prevent-host-death family protein
MKTLSILEGKNKFSQVISDAAAGEPQIITRNGKETAVVISIDEFRRMSDTGKSLVEVLLDNPARKYGIELDLSRSKDTGRPPIDFSEDE